jgi:hypothetical protein
VIKLGLSNFYGQVKAFEHDGKFYMSLDNYDGTDEIQISEELYRVIEREFNN